MNGEARASVGQRALVVGYGKSGRAAARLLHALGVEVFAYDAKVPNAPAEGWVARSFFGHPLDAAPFEGVDEVVLSPGVPPEPVRAQAALHAPGARISGEFGLALELACGGTSLPRPEVVLVTGTNGKSTVTSLTAELLAAAGRRVAALGNLGDPISDRVADALLDEKGGREGWPEVLVLEASSFQLETYRAVPTRVAMLLNVTPDHLDRYPSVEAYAATKLRIFDGLTQDGLALVDGEDASLDHLLAPLREGLGDRLCWVGREDRARLEGPQEARVLRIGACRMPREALRLPGLHNAKNALFALAAARHLGVTRDACVRGLLAYEGLPHRMAFVRELDGVAYFDDSKATNVASVLAGLDGFERRFVLIAGGRPKGDDLGALVPVLSKGARALVAIGEASETLCQLARGVVPCVRAESLPAAVVAARAFAEPGDAVVLSPACASYDQFRDYHHRAEVFVAAVHELESGD